MSQKTKHFYEFGAYRVDLANHLLLRDGEVVALPPKAFDILLALVEESGQVLQKDDLMRRVWPDSFVEEANLSHHIFTLRKALGEDRNGAR
ncbi:MAG TPA: winged helix-turn-helix domain-containing protein, partial [Blastocatellia bacterium]|nr:winged helix-turn-helix domain-containing protein [Blastocatellia bacterium]